ncbi:hypothetical protein HO173_011765 [Letharia columbiana]|uniref:Nucleoside phosphorylase domain-containing protein n=1 Tax=Letharia columbiana TaxID=112416 RepID=A0A8H6FHZ3_9LECA|nr:uncharacterized protein HO173_011765 [Letharia columbiana]KAF6228649.1 hypothetical protein HO173_011765 [Letharia columbiana]
MFPPLMPVNIRNQRKVSVVPCSRISMELIGNMVVLKSCIDTICIDEITKAFTSDKIGQQPVSVRLRGPNKFHGFVDLCSLKNMVQCILRLYTVGWICALQTEYVAACELLDEELPPLQTALPHDNNAYTFGRINDHYIVIACLPKGRYGLASAASVAKDMLRSFDSIRVGLMVGIGGAAPSDKHDIRLGDVVVGCPVKKEGGVIPYNFGKAVQEMEFVSTGSLNSPPTVLLTNLTKLSAYHERKGNHIAESVRKMVAKNQRLGEKYQHPGVENDRLYESSYTHQGGDDRCEICCDQASPPVLHRSQRLHDLNKPVVHYGLIASADTLMKDAIARDRLIKKHDILCFEMEAAGLMNDFPCVVIRGICDYSDSHKNDMWQGYAAVAAASYAKELLGIIPAHQIASTQTATAEMGE